MNEVAEKYGINQEMMDNLKYYKSIGNLKEVFVSDTNGSPFTGIFFYCKVGDVEEFTNYYDWEFSDKSEVFLFVLLQSLRISNISGKAVHVGDIKEMPMEIVDRVERLI